MPSNFLYVGKIVSHIPVSTKIITIIESFLNYHIYLKIMIILKSKLLLLWLVYWHLIFIDMLVNDFCMIFNWGHINLKKNKIPKRLLVKINADMFIFLKD